ncbi:MAG: hypothetical protein V4494_01160 [Chlamydiota bacterium]
MKKINKKMMKNLSFPDFEVEKMEFSSQEKTLRIFVEGAWLDIDGGSKLGKGVLLFTGWETLSITKFNSNTQKWSPLEEFSAQPLKDLCEVKFFDSTVSLSGFSKETGQWIEWKIVNTKMCAEFNL